VAGEEVRLSKEMGQANEKMSALDEKFRNVETVRDELRKKVKEAEVNVDIVEILNEKQSEEQSKDERIREMEHALQEAFVEREQILSACQIEIEEERNIAFELEQKLMEDFEWKLREVEGDHKTKIKNLEQTIDSKEEYEKMNVEMEERMNRMRADNIEKIEEYEAKISSLLSGKMDMVFQVKEEVEVEYTQRMEGLRDIYRNEITQLTEQHTKCAEKWKHLEEVLNTKIADKKAECEENISYYSMMEANYENKLDELMTRLQELTSMYMKLQDEFENKERHTEEEKTAGGSKSGVEKEGVEIGGEEGGEKLDGGSRTHRRNILSSALRTGRIPTRLSTHDKDVVWRKHNVSFLHEGDEVSETKVSKPSPSFRTGWPMSSTSAPLSNSTKTEPRPGVQFSLLRGYCNLGVKATSKKEISTSSGKTKRWSQCLQSRVEE